MKKLILVILLMLGVLNAKNYYGIDISKDFNTTGYVQEAENSYVRFDCHFDEVRVVTRDNKPYQIILTKHFYDDIIGAHTFYKDTQKSLDKAYPKNILRCDKSCQKERKNFRQALFEERIECLSKYKDKAMKSIHLSLESDKLNESDVTVFYRLKSTGREK